MESYVKGSQSEGIEAVDVCSKHKEYLDTGNVIALKIVLGEGGEERGERGREGRVGGGRGSGRRGEVGGDGKWEERGSRGGERGGISYPS